MSIPTVAAGTTVATDSTGATDSGRCRLAAVRRSRAAAGTTRATVAAGTTHSSVATLRGFLTGGTPGRACTA